MQFNEFQDQTIKSIAIDDKSVAALAHRSLGLSGEAGVISNQIKKVIRDKDGKLSDEDVATLKEKLGDVLYYVSALADFADITLDDVAQQQLGKSAAFLKNRQ